MKKQNIDNLIQQYGENCFYCGEKVEKTELHRDHVIPKKFGGKSDIENLRPSCMSCNCQKHDMSLIEWQIYVFKKLEKVKQDVKRYSRIVDVLDELMEMFTEEDARVFNLRREELRDLKERWGR